MADFNFAMKINGLELSTMFYVHTV